MSQRECRCVCHSPIYSKPLCVHCTPTKYVKGDKALYCGWPVEVMEVSERTTGAPDYLIQFTDGEKMWAQESELRGATTIEGSGPTL